jgi:TonB family protein
VKKLWITILGLFCIAVLALPSAATECPVSIEYIFLNSLGAAKGFAQYQITAQSKTAAPTAIRFKVIENGATHGSTVYAPEVDFIAYPPGSLMADREAMLLFPWKTADVTGIAVQEVSRLDNQEVVTCTEAPVTLSRSGVVQTSWYFDDSKLHQNPEMVASRIEPPVHWLRRVLPEYPEMAKESNVQGKAFIGVTLGKSGDIISSWVYKSSGSVALDKASLTAARASTFVEPLAEGTSVTATVIIRYYFTLE